MSEPQNSNEATEEDATELQFPKGLCKWRKRNMRKEIPLIRCVQLIVSIGNPKEICM